MTTVRNLIERAFRRSNLVDIRETLDAEDAKNGLEALNDMLYGWKNEGVDIALQSDFVLTDTFEFFVPPGWDKVNLRTPGLIAGALHRLNFKGAWNASTNTPALSSNTGTQGWLYKVSVAGATPLDNVTIWAVNDYALYDGQQWHKGQSSRTHERDVIALLAIRLCEEYGATPTPVLIRDADNGWANVLSNFIIPGEADFERGVSHMPSQRYIDYYGRSDETV